MSKRTKQGFTTVGCLAILIPFAIVGVVGYFVFYRPFVGDTITLPPNPLIAIESCSTVRVTGDPNTNSITLKSNWTNRSTSNHRWETEGNAIYIKGSGCWDLAVQVPAKSDLQIIATTAIEVYGVTGVLQLKGGTITVIKSQLQGKSQLEASSSRIYFNGLLAPDADVKVLASSAPVDILLPKESSFQFVITDYVQSFNTTFFIPPAQSNTPIVSEIASDAKGLNTKIGSNPTAKLTIQGSSSVILLTGV